MSTRFDRDYYQRFYFDPRTAVVSRAEMNARARLISAYADHIGLLEAQTRFITEFGLKPQRSRLKLLKR